ncbi:MAG: hypothetical protein HY703_13290 [Gemmatimonadetes bacterium]|nr:hypothetical protein [Gemmatimonadota bacterium]
MRHPSLYRVGGNALLVGAVLFAAGALLHAAQPETLDEAASLAAGQWALSHWLLGIGFFLILGGFVALVRHFGGGELEGWAALGLGGVVLGTAGGMVLIAPEAATYPMLTEMQGAGGEDAVAASHAFLAINSGLVMGVFAMAVPAFWAGTTLFALAVARDAAFPRGLGYAGAAVGVANVAAIFLVQSFTVHRALGVLGAAWLALLGVSMARLGRAAPTAAPTGAMAGSGA